MCWTHQSFSEGSHCRESIHIHARGIWDIKELHYSLVVIRCKRIHQNHCQGFFQVLWNCRYYLRYSQELIFFCELCMDYNYFLFFILFLNLFRKQLAWISGLECIKHRWSSSCLVSHIRSFPPYIILFFCKREIEIKLEPIHVLLHLAEPDIIDVWMHFLY